MFQRGYTKGQLVSVGLKGNEDPSLQPGQSVRARIVSGAPNGGYNVRLLEGSGKEALVGRWQIMSEYVLEITAKQIKQKNHKMKGKRHTYSL